MQRLNKFIASSGFCSRRKADEYIENGDVVVNGRIIKELGFQVGPKDKVSVEGKLLTELFTLILNNIIYKTGAIAK